MVTCITWTHLPLHLDGLVVVLPRWCPGWQAAWCCGGGGGSTGVPGECLPEQLLLEPDGLLEVGCVGVHGLRREERHVVPVAFCIWGCAGGLVRWGLGGRGGGWLV